MFRRFSRVFASVMATVLALSVSLVSAQGPQPQGNPQPQGTEPNTALSAGAASAKSLKESLTAAQAQSIKAVLDRYAPELAAITAQLNDPNATRSPGRYRLYLPTILGSGATTAAASAGAAVDQQALLAVTSQLSALRLKIDAEVAAVLSSEQQALNAQNLAQLTNSRQPVTSIAASDSSAAGLSGSATLQANSGYCYAGAQYASVGAFWANEAAYYAYYNYIYNYYGSYSAYYNMYYSDAYAFTGFEYVSAGYFDLIMLGSDYQGFVGAGIANNYNGYYYAFYGASYAASNYASFSYYYAYYAWVYGVYARDNEYNA